MSQEIEYAALSEIFLDPMNPRLGRALRDRGLTQDEVYDCMRDWSLEELATSFLESGFWVHEAVLCVVEEIDGLERLVVVEGNRRIAALMRLRKTYEGVERSPKWLGLTAGTEAPADLFAAIPYIRVAERSDIDAFLGFRHVTGIKEWRPPEKAAFIAKMISERGISYRDVMRIIGSKTPVVERHYIAYCILSQMRETEDLDAAGVEGRFSLLFLSLRSKRVQRFLGVQDKFGITPSEVAPPVDDEHIEQLREYSIWLFGDEETPPIVQDSRQIDKFALVLSSEDALKYLRAMRKPSLARAYFIAGGEQEELYDIISIATYNLQEALSVIHLYKRDEKLLKMVKRLIKNTDQIRKTLDVN